ncbi:hypothetical protein B6U90_03845 [Thermoplasmatales archaeon ex4484_6]|nr:MAG: hypothetical protein B6U90_03845 [Thermoplasmatales archaeon ex4484_6]
MIAVSFSVINMNSGGSSGIADERPTRDPGYTREENPEYPPLGGEVIDFFNNPEYIERMDNISLKHHHVTASNLYEDDFESYPLGTDLTTSVNYTRHPTMNSGDFSVERVFEAGSSQSAMHSKNSSSIPSVFMTKGFDLSRFTLKISFNTQTIRYNGKFDFKIQLMSAETSNTTDDDIVLSIGTMNGYIRVETGDSIHSIGHLISQDEWVDCTFYINLLEKKFSLTVNPSYSSIVYYNNKNIEGDFSNISRLQTFLPANQSNTLFLDFFTIYDWDGEAWFETVPIEIPEDMELSLFGWGTGYFSEIRLTVLGNDGSPIPGLIKVTLYREMSLKGKVPRSLYPIKLRIDLIKDLYNVPTLYYWRLCWQSIHGYWDPLWNNNGIGYLSSIITYDGELRMVWDQWNGVAITKTILKPADSYWEYLKLNYSLGVSGKIQIDILDSVNGRSIPGFGDLRGKNIDLSNLDPVEYNSIKIRFRLKRDSVEESHFPHIYDVGVSWVDNQHPVLENITVADRIHRTMEANVTVVLNDTDQNVENLRLELLLKENGSDEWNSSFSSSFTYDEVTGRFLGTIAPSPMARLGNCSFRINVTDELGWVTTFDLMNITSIENVRPEPPLFSIYPSAPTTEDSIYIRLDEPGFDLEGVLLTYRYRFYINGELQNLATRENATFDDYGRLINTFTKKGDTILCEVASWDGVEFSEPSFKELIISDSPPVFIGDAEQYLVITEDTPLLDALNVSTLFTDADEDVLLFNISSNGNMTLILDENDELDIFPGENYSADCNLTVTASDGFLTATHNYTVYFDPVNDPPAGKVTIDVEPGPVEIGTEVHLSVDIWDADSDVEDLFISWYVNGDETSNKPFLNKTLDTEGEINITVWVMDRDDERLLGTFVFDVFIPEPPYEASSLLFNHNGTSSPIVFDVMDIFGHSGSVRNEDIGPANITNIRTEVDYTTVRIIMTLDGEPLPYSEMDPSFGKGEWCIYRLFFVNDMYSEGAFDPNSLGLFDIGYIQPDNGSYYPLGDVDCLSYGDGNELGSPRIDGNSIIWTLEMEQLVSWNIPAEDLEIFGSTYYVRSLGDSVICGFDTAGHGANGNKVIIVKEEKPKEEKGISPLVIIIPVLILLILLFIAIAVFITIRKGREKTSTDTDKEEREEEKTEGHLHYPPGHPALRQGMPFRMPVPPPVQVKQGPPREGKEEPGEGVTGGPIESTPEGERIPEIDPGAEAPETPRPETDR